MTLLFRSLLSHGLVSPILQNISVNSIKTFYPTRSFPCTPPDINTCCFVVSVLAQLEIVKIGVEHLPEPHFLSSKLNSYSA